MPRRTYHGKAMNMKFEGATLREVHQKALDKLTEKRKTLTVTLECGAKVIASTLPGRNRIIRSDGRVIFAE